MENRFNKKEAQECHDALNEIMKGIPKTKCGEFIGHFNDIFLFLTAAKEAAPELE